MKKIEIIWTVFLVVIIILLVFKAVEVFVQWLTCKYSSWIRIQSINNLDNPSCNNITTDNTDILCFCMWWVHINNNKCYREKWNPNLWWYYFEPIYEFNFIFK